MKVHELSKELNIENKELLEILQGLGIEAKSHLSAITEEQAQKVRDTLGKVTLPQQVKKQWKPDLQRMICVKNISRGKLIYKSKRQMGYKIEWAKKGDKNYIELGEFISLKNTDRRFVTEPWIRIVEEDEVEILKYANIYHYYEQILDINHIADILHLDFESFKKKFDKLPEGFKSAVAEQAADMIHKGTLDSIKIKQYIEKTMEIELDILIKAEGKNRSSSFEIK